MAAISWSARGLRKVGQDNATRTTGIFAGGLPDRADSAIGVDQALVGEVVYYSRFPGLYQVSRERFNESIPKYRQRQIKKETVPLEDPLGSVVYMDLSVGVLVR